MNNICLLGLSRSGKTCYLYAATNVLSGGIRVGNDVISILSRDERKCIRLNRGIEDMERGWWPTGSKQTMVYPFYFMVDGQKQFPFTLYDYRGGVLNDLTEGGANERNRLYGTFRNSSCIISFIDGCTLLDAMEPHLNDEGNRLTQTQARNQIGYMEVLIHRYKENIGADTPILLVITKQDLFTKELFEAGVDLLISRLPTLFSRRNDMVVGITGVSLGQNLSVGKADDDGRKAMSGSLLLNTSQNLHIPILFALFQSVEMDSDSYCIMRDLFTPDVIRLYRGGEEAVICM